MHTEDLSRLLVEIFFSSYFDIKDERVIYLLLGTAAQESFLGDRVYQIKGPARGIFGMEPATMRDLFTNYIDFHRNYLDLLIKATGFDYPNELNLAGNIIYQALLTYFHYKRYGTWKRLSTIPTQEDYAKEWKKYYNTIKGKGTIEQFTANYTKYGIDRLRIIGK